ncbi:uncharacterized protein Z518_10139 [Rhinocladiella mackenziei CBS 650.93]|uniref:Major facilitator superfamily (MFS) profile domain-containing protein n=1 Tax=Rhinocladiella mackenziei CBS 650.93 TaxID=1442369 RepID=A0A0D2GS06_9EURO|nr:uncharacterized protein Z518_10139 [Rhinocladiella mackenziei CBS 650.93]KIX01073.1 hypothetical protein Z518_10139 [Rhinocladiella mackenziei CBS 650.93]
MAISSPTGRDDISAQEKIIEDRVDNPASFHPVTASAKDVENLPEIDYAAEDRLIRKLDWYIIPPTMLLYLFSFLDRVNIGNARLYGMEEDLGLEGSQYQTAVSILFLTYVLSETPSNLVLKKLRPSRWIAFITAAWGIVATLTGLVQNYGGLIACRLILGALEGGLFPGMTLYLTMFYGKREIALRVGYLFVSAALAGSVGGLLAYGIGFMDGVSGQKGWRWIMIIEGLPSIVLGVAAYWWLADDPETAYYLSQPERDLMVIRKRRQIGHTTSADFMHKEDVIKAFKDWRVWMFCFGQFGVDTMLYGYSTFLPTIIKGLGTWSTAQTQALTVPCYALGAITYLIVAHISDRFQKRGLAAVTFCMISIVGYIILITDVSSGAHYFGCFMVAMGLYVAVGIPLAWLPSNQPRYGSRATATGLQLTIGNCSGIMAPFLYKTNEAPRYIRGHAVSLSMVGLAGVIYAIMSAYFMALNQNRRAGKEDAIIIGKTEEEIAEMGDRNPRYVFTY